MGCSRLRRAGGDSAVIMGSQLAPLLNVGVLFCGKVGNFGKGTKAHYIMRKSDHKYLCSGRHSSCLELSELSEGLVLTTLDFYFFLEFQVVNKALKYIQISWLWGTIGVKPKRTTKFHPVTCILISVTSAWLMQVWSPFEDVKDAGVAISFGSLFHEFMSLTGGARHEPGKKTENKVYLYLTT